MNRAHYNPALLAELREAKGFSQQQVADKLGVARNTVSRAETGEIASYDLLLHLSNLYDVNIKDLLYDYPQAA